MEISIFNEIMSEWQELVTILLLWLAISFPPLMALYYYGQRIRRENVMMRSGRANIDEATAYQTMERTLADLSHQLSELQTGRRADHLTLLRVLGELEIWKAYSRKLYQRLQDANVPDIPALPDVEVALEVDSIDDGKLYREMTLRFNMSEIDDIAFVLGIDESISGDTVAAKTRSLVREARKRGILLELLTYVRQERPKGDWK